MAKVSDGPFKETLLKLLAERDMSQRELIRHTRLRGWGSLGTISHIMQNENAPSVRAMEAIATALQIRPEYFAEYRLAKARNALDPQVVGIKAALHGLSAVKAALRGE